MTLAWAYAFNILLTSSPPYMGGDSYGVQLKTN